MACNADDHTKPLEAGATLRSRFRALALLVIGVVVLHMLVLHGLAQALAGVQPSSASVAAFTVRTVVRDAPPPSEAPLAHPPGLQANPLPQALRPLEPVTPTARAAEVRDASLRDTPAVAPEVKRDAPEAANASVSVLAQRAVEPLMSGQASAAMASASATAVQAGGGGVYTNATQPDYDYQVPGSARLKYKGSGTKGILSLPVSAELLWTKVGRSYDARLELGLLGFSRVQTSNGAIGPRGLEPLRFGDKTRSEEAAHFQRAKGIISFSANGPDAPLMPLAQDLLSIYMQLASMWNANPQRFRPGMQLPFQLVEKHRSGSRLFTVGATERLKVDGSEMVATRLVCDPSADYDNRVEVWLAPALDYLPARIRMTQANGDEVDIYWSSTEKP